MDAIKNAIDAEVEKRVNEATKGYKEFIQKIENLEKENAKDKKDLSDIEDRLDFVNNKMHTRTAELAEQCKMNKELIEERDELRDLITEVKMDRQALQEENAQLKAQVAQIEQERTKLNDLKRSFQVFLGTDSILSSPVSETTTPSAPVQPVEETPNESSPKAKKRKYKKKIAIVSRMSSKALNDRLIKLNDEIEKLRKKTTVTQSTKTRTTFMKRSEDDVEYKLREEYARCIRELKKRGEIQPSVMEDPYVN